ncbi:DUF3843 family protein [Bacteroides oleiciplenus]|uniref:DUF3843 family protein n=1 Tax=Bacteroides oleiciplenus TaxID=626931 RepID=A0A3E5BSN8_9BACE|nr:DUF3843 family protein [Bacteroides oleiciplenus]RGN40395.1 DUF3843 family protein [Bacteroides oleiciplenus]
MKQARIYMKRWLGANERSKQVSTDSWYLGFSDQLLSLIDQSPLYSKKFEEEKVNAAVSLTLYLQDAIAQSGGWKEFSDAYHRLYKSYLPFYKLTDSYVPDEINVEDISFVLWTLLSRYAVFEEDEVIIQNPHDPDLVNLSQKVYDAMDTSFEEAPICSEPSTPIWVMGLDLLEMDMVPLPEIKPGMPLKKDVESCLAYSKGEPLLYFATYDELRKFFVEELKWANKDENLLPELRDERNFVIYANAKGMLVGPNTSYCFCDPNNPTYDAAKAATQGYNLFTYPGACPFDVLKYGMAKGLFPDLQLPFPGGKEVLHEYWDFIARYFLCEYYEGE